MMLKSEGNRRVLPYTLFSAALGALVPGSVAANGHLANPLH
jgi:hypothetical protein